MSRTDLRVAFWEDPHSSSGYVQQLCCTKPKEHLLSLILNKGKSQNEL